jgi:metallo-beta-lactamase class B
MMAKSLKFLSVFLLLLALTLYACSRVPSRPVSSEPLARFDLADDLYLRQIGEGAYVITHSYPWPANSLLVEMADGTLVLAGSTYTPEAAQSVLEWAARQFGQRQVVGIDTGYHVDNLGGNQTLLENGFPVYGSDLTVGLLESQGEHSRQMMLDLIGDPQSLYYKAYQEMEFIPPDHVFPINDGLTLTFGSEQVQVFYPGPSQAPDKVVVYFLSRKLLFGSCMVLGGDTIGNTADADLTNWPEAIRKLEQFDVDVVVPGHGDRLDPGLIQHTLDLLAPSS